METILSEAVAGWQNFYMLAGVSAATLIGLLFVSVSMHINTIVSLQETDAVRALADQTFRNFILILSFAFIFTIPDPTPHGTGIPLLILGLLSLWRTVKLWTKFGRISKIHIIKAEQLLRQLLIPNTICYLALIGISIFDPGQCRYPQMDGSCGGLPHNRCPDQRLDADDRLAEAERDSAPQSH